MRTYRHIGSNEQGSTMVEFALVAPVFILLLFGIIEFSAIQFAKSTMEGATSITSRLGKTGYTQDGMTRQEMLIALVKEKSMGILDPERIEVTTLVYDSFSDIGQSEPLSIDANGNGHYDPADGDAYQDINGNGQWDSDLGEAGLGGAGDIVVYKLHYPWQVKTPVMNKLLVNADGYFPLDVSVVVRNEPYESGA
jgi:hypothetical protein